MLIDALEKSVEDGRIGTYLVKGGAAIEIQFGERARATRDLDLELPVPVSLLRETLVQSLSVGSGDFTFVVGVEEQRIRDEAVRVEVQMLFQGRPWATLDVDLAPTESDEGVAHIQVELDQPELRVRARAAPPARIIAQKLHALSSTDPAQRAGYARHVVDILYLARGVPIEEVRLACEETFAYREAASGRGWPPSSIELPASWEREYAAAIQGFPSFELKREDVAPAFQRFLLLLIGGMVAVAGYEYRFHALRFSRSENAQEAVFGGPIVSHEGDIQFEGFSNLTRQGWRVRTVAEIHARGGPELLVVLEREVS